MEEYITPYFMKFPSLEKDEKFYTMDGLLELRDKEYMKSSDMKFSIEEIEYMIKLIVK